MYKALLLILILAQLFPGLSQNIKTDSVDYILESITIQSDLFGHDPQEFPGSISVVTPLELERANSVQLQPILNSIPGVYMQSGALNTNRITIRGIGARSPFATNKVKAYLDEIPLSSGEGETTVEDIDFSTLGGIEVYRGPVSTTYGAGLGGAIHMISKNPERGSKVFVESSLGSYGLFRNQVGLQMSSSNKSLSLFYQDVTSDGYRENNEYDRQSITLLGKILIGKKSTISTYLNYSDLLAYIPSSLNEEDYINNPTSAASAWGNAGGNESSGRFRAGLSLFSEWNDKTESTLALFMNTGASDEIRPVFLGNTGVDFTNFGIRGSLKRKFMNDDQLTLAVGTEVFFEDFTYREFENINSENGVVTLDFSQKRNYGNVFLVSEFRPTERWLLTLGGNFNWSDYQLRDDLGQGTDNQTGEYQFNPIFSPKLSVTRFIRKELAIYGLVAHGFSLPTFEETLYPEGQVNSDLKPEAGFNYEIGMKGSLWQEKLKFELAGYSMHVDNLIVDQVIDNIPVGVNAGSAIHNGLEILLDHSIVKTRSFDLKQRLSLTLMSYHFEDFVDGANDYSGNQMTGVPERTLDYLVGFSTGFGLYGNANWQHVGEMPILDDNSIYSDTYNLINVKLGYQKEFGSFGLNVYGGVNNVFDEKYASMIQINTFTERYYYPGLPTNYYLGAKLTYSFN